MIRSNVGNVVTNATQIMSVGATTAGRLLGKADSALNNLSEQEKTDYFEMKANKMRDETKAYNEKSGEVESIDDIMESMGVQRMNNSEQTDNLMRKINRDSQYSKFWKAMQQEPAPLDEILKDLGIGGE
jgi:hypothetical protein